MIQTESDGSPEKKIEYYYYKTIILILMKKNKQTNNWRANPCSNIDAFILSVTLIYQPPVRNWRQQFSLACHLNWDQVFKRLKGFCDGRKHVPPFSGKKKKKLFRTEPKSKHRICSERLNGGC